jgi:hypothetical protein
VTISLLVQSENKGEKKMKKLLVVFVLYAVIHLAAAPIDLIDLTRAAANFYLERTGEPSEVIETYALREQQDAVLWVINMDNGFVILSADDTCIPVFAYSNEGKFDNNNIPPQLQQLLQWQKKEIYHDVKAGYEPSRDISLEWSRLLAHNFTPLTSFRNVAPLLDTNWDQGQYYNALCPADAGGPGGHVWAGCVATAMAQVMKYWEFPDTGTGSHSYYHYNYGTQAANFGTTTYQWDNMPNSVYNYNTPVATLLYHLGVSIDMDYGIDGSGAYASDARDALVNYFSYQNAAALLWKNNYNSSTWNTMLRDELDGGRPLVYRGQDYSSGHAFNLDGYQGTDYFHVNWGWSGSSNGYFYLNDLTPGSSNYTLQQAAIFYLQPSLQPQIEVVSPNGNEIFNLGDTINITWTSQDIGDSVKILLYNGTSIADVIVNQTANDGSFDWSIPSNHEIGDTFRIKIMDYDNNLVYDYSDTHFFIIDPVAELLEDVQITISSADVNEGDTLNITIVTSELLPEWNLISFQFSLLYDESLLNFSGYSQGDFMGNLLAYESLAGHIDIAFANAMPLSGSGNLINLNFTATNPGTTSLFIPDFRYNTYDIDNIISGTVNIIEYSPFQDVIITAGSAAAAIGTTLDIPVSTTELTTQMGAISFQFDLHFDNSILTYEGFALGDVPNPGNLIANESSPGVISVAYANVMPVTGEGSLCFISFATNAAGSSDLVLDQFKYNSTYLDNLVNGSITVSDVQYPDWYINPPDYEYNASIWGIVMLDDVEVSVTSGMLGCFVGDECRGLASYEDGSVLDYTVPFGHIIFLPMVYSNQTSGETLEFLYFDAISGEIYPIAETMELIADMVIGNGFDPFVFHASTSPSVTITKNMVPGWNWFSLNVTGDDMSTGSVLASIGDSGTNIKNQSQSAIYYAGAGWFGSLNNINNLSLYKLEAINSATWEFTGVPVDLASTAYNLNGGWNWISYAPQEPEAINYALGGLENGTNIKNQSQSAIYYAGAGWFGSLSTLHPTAGYMLQMNDAEQHYYPAPDGENSAVRDINEIERDPDWMINPPDYEFNGFIWGVVEVDGVLVEDINDMIGVFYEDECRGIATQTTNSVQDYTNIAFGHVAFMPQVYSNAVSGETFTFKYYDASKNMIYDVEETLEWTVDMVVGNGFDPFVFSVNTNDTTEQDIIENTRITACYPNPFNPSINIAFYLQDECLTILNIYNTKGQKVRSLTHSVLHSGNHSFIWDGKDDRGSSLANAVYFYSLTTPDASLSGKILMLK